MWSYRKITKSHQAQVVLVVLVVLCLHPAFFLCGWISGVRNRRRFVWVFPCNQQPLSCALDLYSLYYYYSVPWRQPEEALTPKRPVTLKLFLFFFLSNTLYSLILAMWLQSMASKLYLYIRKHKVDVKELYCWIWTVYWGSKVPQTGNSSLKATSGGSFVWEPKAQLGPHISRSSSAALDRARETQTNLSSR